MTKFKSILLLIAINAIFASTAIAASAEKQLTTQQQAFKDLSAKLNYNFNRKFAFEQQVLMVSKTRTRVISSYVGDLIFSENNKFYMTQFSDPKDREQNKFAYKMISNGNDLYLVDNKIQEVSTYQVSDNPNNGLFDILSKKNPSAEVQITRKGNCFHSTSLVKGDPQDFDICFDDANNLVKIIHATSEDIRSVYVLSKALPLSDKDLLKIYTFDLKKYKLIPKLTSGKSQKK